MSSRIWALVLMGGLALPLGASTPGQKDFESALRESRAGHNDAAFVLAERAAAAAPENGQYRTVREFLRQRATLEHLRHAHDLVLARDASAAAVEFRSALGLDPSNRDAHLGLAGLFPQASSATERDAASMRVQRAAPLVELAPQAGERDFDLADKLHVVLGKVASAYGLKAYVANSVPDTKVRLHLTDATYAEAMAALHAVAEVDEIALEPDTVYFIGSRQYDDVAPVGLRTFYLPWADNGKDLTEIANILKNLLGVREVTVSADEMAIAVRARPQQLDAAEQLLLDFQQARGEVVLEMQILDVSATAAHDLGLDIPSQFTMFALGPLLEQLKNSGQAQQILDLFEQGGLNAVLNSGDLAGLLSGSGVSSLLQNPFVTFGGGATLMAVSVPNAKASFSSTNGRFQSVESALLRSRNGEQATLKIGQRIPILNASFSPISLSPAISKVIANGSFLQPFPSFSYQDIGLDAKLTPRLTGTDGVRLQLDLTSNALTGRSLDAIPILSNRHVVTNLSLKDGEPAIIAGLFTRKELESLTGLPGISLIPGFNRLFATESSQPSRDQLLLVVTPHIVQAQATQAAAIWLPASFGGTNAGGAPPPSIFNLGNPARRGGAGGGDGGDGGGGRR